MSKQIKAIREAADPFMRVSRMMDPLSIPDDRPLREVLPGVWPTWGDFQDLIAAIGAVREQSPNASGEQPKTEATSPEQDQGVGDRGG